MTLVRGCSDSLISASDILHSSSKCRRGKKRVLSVVRALKRRAVSYAPRAAIVPEQEKPLGSFPIFCPPEVLVIASPLAGENEQCSPT